MSYCEPVPTYSRTCYVNPADSVLDLLKVMDLLNWAAETGSATPTFIKVKADSLSDAVASIINHNIIVALENRRLVEFFEEVKMDGKNTIYHRYVLTTLVMKCVHVNYCFFFMVYPVLS